MMLARCTPLGLAFRCVASCLGLRLFPSDRRQSVFEALDDVGRQGFLPLWHDIGVVCGRDLFDAISRERKQGLQLGLGESDPKAARHSVCFHGQRSLSQGLRPASGSLYSRAV